MIETRMSAKMHFTIKLNLIHLALGNCLFLWHLVTQS